MPGFTTRERLRHVVEVGSADCAPLFQWLPERRGAAWSHRDKDERKRLSNRFGEMIRVRPTCAAAPQRCSAAARARGAARRSAVHLIDAPLICRAPSQAYYGLEIAGAAPETTKLRDLIKAATDHLPDGDDCFACVRTRVLEKLAAAAPAAEHAPPDVAPGAME